MGRVCFKMVSHATESEIKKLTNRIKDITDENGRLHHLVSQQDAQISNLKKQFKIKSLSKDPIEDKVEQNPLLNASTCAKISELSKELRDKSSMLQAEIMKNHQLEQKIKHFESKPEGKESKIEIRS